MGALGGPKRRLGSLRTPKLEAYITGTSASPRECRPLTES
jgi:hypothetical protein